MMITRLKETVNIANYNILIGGRNFNDQPINNRIKKYDELRKIATGKGDDYATGSYWTTNTSKVITN